MKTIHVAAAAIRNQNGQVLLSMRHPDAHQGGLWEFPGGKLEPDESVAQALRRELLEELGIQITRHRSLIRIRHDYSDRRVLLDVHLVTAWQGQPRGLESQPLRWVTASDLDAYPMPAADRPIVRALQLPPVYLITNPQVVDSRRFLENLGFALEQGVRLLQFRVFGLEKARHRRLARRALDLCREQGARMLMNHDLQLAQELDAHGVHLNRRQLQMFESRPLADEKLLSASCHSVVELLQAQALGVDFSVLSPVLPTRSHPAADPLGWGSFAEMVDRINIPVYALGGMQPDLLRHAWSLGAQGVAGIRMQLSQVSAIQRE